MDDIIVGKCIVLLGMAVPIAVMMVYYAIKSEIEGRQAERENKKNAAEYKTYTEEWLRGDMSEPPLPPPNIIVRKG